MWTVIFVQCYLKWGNLVVGGVLILITIVVIATAFSLQKTWHAVRTLRARCATELSQLSGHLANHHLIVSHLVDSLPETFANQFDRAELTAVRERAERSIHSIDTSCPRATEMRKFSIHQKELFESVESLTERLTESPSVFDIQSVSGCLQGLTDANQTISDATSAYNAAVITYSTYLESPQSSLIARIFKSQAEFCMVDLGQYSTGSSAYN
ncbi:MAG: hypothetical protein ACR2NM_11315 [Bythopirellula sp.]